MYRRYRCPFMPDSSSTRVGYVRAAKVVRSPRIRLTFRGDARIKRNVLTPARGALPGGLPRAHPKPENPAVTWCYNRSGGITSFGSTPFRHTHKLPSKDARTVVAAIVTRSRGERPGTGPPWPERRVPGANVGQVKRHNAGRGVKTGTVGIGGRINGLRCARPCSARFSGARRGRRLCARAIHAHDARHALDARAARRHGVGGRLPRRP